MLATKNPALGGGIRELVDAWFALRCARCGGDVNLQAGSWNNHSVVKYAAHAKSRFLRELKIFEYKWNSEAEIAFFRPRLPRIFLGSKCDFGKQRLVAVNGHLCMLKRLIFWADKLLYDAKARDACGQRREQKLPLVHAHERQLVV